MRYTPRIPLSQPTRGHHGTHQGDTAEDSPTVRPRHRLPANSLPRTHPTSEPIAPPSTMGMIRPSHTPPLPTHGRRTAATTRARRRDPPTRRPQKHWQPARCQHTALPAPLAPLTVGPTPPGPTPQRPRTAHVLKHTRGTTRRPHGAALQRPRTSHQRPPTPPDLDTVPPPPCGERHHATQHHDATAHPPPPPGDMRHHSPPTQERRHATPALHPPHPPQPAPPLETPHTTHQLNAHHQGRHRRPGQPPTSRRTPQPRQTVRFPGHWRTAQHRPPHIPRAPT